MLPAIWTWVSSVISTAVILILVISIPAVRAAIGKYVAGFVQNYFDQRIENLRHELRCSEEKFASYLRTNEQQLRSLTETALSLRSTRQAALDARRLQAVEKLWTAKIATDRMRMAAQALSHLNLEEVLKAAKTEHSKTQQFGEALVSFAGLDPAKAVQEASAQSERPFLSSEVWQIFSAYQGVMIHSVIIINAIASGTTQLLKKDDTLKPLMLLVLPEYTSYIEQFGFSGYYNLLDVLEQKLLNSIAEILDGNTVDEVTLKRSAAIISAARELDTKPKLKIPDELQSSEIPPPSED